jgi:hypothetical protein
MYAAVLCSRAARSVAVIAGVTSVHDVLPPLRALFLSEIAVSVRAPPPLLAHSLSR